MEILKTKGDTHTDLTGFCQVERKYPDQIITDDFRVVRKIDSTEDTGGNCYDWYEIDHHFRTTDRTGPISARVEQGAAEMENALCEQDTAMDERMSALEDAVCELDSVINNVGGEI